MHNYLIGIGVYLGLTFIFLLFDKAWDYIERTKVFNNYACYKNCHKLKFHDYSSVLKLGDIVSHDHFICTHCNKRIELDLRKKLKRYHKVE
jgi:Fe2+ or Zn2+ uptake regulation protein